LHCSCIFFIYLTGLILKSLRNYHSNKSINSKLNNLLIEIELLFDKELYDLAYYRIKKAEELAKLPEILEVHHVAGEDCYLIKLRHSNNKSLAEFLREKLGTIPTITSTRTIIVLNTVKETCSLKLPETKD